jgi:hypothetical protein
MYRLIAVAIASNVASNSASTSLSTNNARAAVSSSCACWLSRPASFAIIRGFASGPVAFNTPESIAERAYIAAS